MLERERAILDTPDQPADNSPELTSFHGSVLEVETRWKS